ncbi:cellulose biosynthesis cyclic di-GMP-binding regulatory protein BcsB [Pseudomonas sp. sp1636]|uniref:cellulose biosynthesis cyclic di-GMP-binding regulatory protein BcsB n=1 Tax=Pseudomonas sp. sp1636 TaxID=3036707 RepID=UPI0025A5B0AE|nr:cellulose biosynthesis cyclic di-GMP-binding regulatory protein BcsB [Pseudomonas sp. sp1636]MDM8349904.1 cellulose biosynthesis cyclic di-GMP-binding regulatory protein BcsB [Pseudomonas sp. sp1636]
MMRQHFARFVLMPIVALLISLGALATPTEPLVTDTPQPATYQRSLSLGELSSPGVLLLRNMLRHLYAEFGVRSDELISAAELQLFYTPSPALNAKRSHVKVYLNDELMGVLPILDQELGQEVNRTLTLDTSFIRDFNHLRFELVGSSDSTPEDPMHASLWLDFSAKSQLQLSVLRLKASNDLAILPEPFFDHRDKAPLLLPFVFSGAPSSTQQTAAAVLASWFGIHSSWRGAAFPAFIGGLPANRSAVVLANNQQRPAFLKDYPRVSAPTLAIIDHPSAPFAKLLLVLGEDDQQVLTAARAVALGSNNLKGPASTLHNQPEMPPRKPYDAPNWVNSDGPTHFSELLDNPLQLQASGLVPPPLSLALKVPADLFIWRSPGVPLDLRYRYTPPLQKESSLLSISINDHFVQAFPLNDPAPGNIAGLAQQQLPLLTHQPGSKRVLIPAQRIGPHNELRMNFTFNALPGCSQDSNCATSLPMNIQAAIDPDSSIDFSAFHHYKAMPDLQAFAASGYPYSRFADLSQTLVLMPPQPSQAELSLLLAIVGRIAAHTGYPATRLSIGDDWQQAGRSQRDLLIVAAAVPAFRRAQGPELSALAEQVAAKLSHPSSRAPRRQTSDAAAELAALIGFKSPFDDQRSVIAMMAGDASGYGLIEQSLLDNQRRARIAGSVTLMHGEHIDSAALGETYYVGSLPWWLMLWFHLADHLLFLVILASLSAVLLASVLFSMLGLLARRRLQAPD